MKDISLTRVSQIILEEEEKLLSPKEIWDKAKKSKKNVIIKKVKSIKGLTPWLTISSNIHRDLKKPKSIFYHPIKRVAKFGLKKYKDKY